jgi:hypothetical protein
MICSSCQRALPASAAFCEFCGQLVAEPQPQLEPQPQPNPQLPEVVQTGAKNFRTVWLISIFGGWLGLDRFYLGHVATGVLKLLGGGWYGVWWGIDLIRLLRGKQRDRAGVLIADPDNFMPKAKLISGVLLTVVALFWLLLLIAAVTPNTGD